ERGPVQRERMIGQEPGLAVGAQRAVGERARGTRFFVPHAGHTRTSAALAPPALALVAIAGALLVPASVAGLAVVAAATLPADALPAATLPADALPAATLPADALPADALPGVAGVLGTRLRRAHEPLQPLAVLGVLATAGDRL